MKKIITLLLCVCFSLTVTGCKSTADNNSSAVSVVDTLVSSTVQTSEIESSDTSSVVSTVPETFDITLTFLGDMILANQKGVSPSGRFSEYADKYSADYFLEKVKHILSADDFTLANLENVLSDRELTPTVKDYDPAFWFKSKTSNINVLTSGSIEGVLLSNNHIMDYGSEGFNDTVQTVTNAGIKYGNDYNIIRLEKNGFRIAIICTGLWGQYNVNNAIKNLQSVQSDSDYQIVFFHGGTEKIHAPEQFKINSARAFVDNGADLVVGGHPHVLQPREIYNGVEIIYSVGNFCYGGAFYPENRTVIYQQTLTVNPSTMTVDSKSSNIIPCYVYTGKINNYQPAPIGDSAVKQKVLDFMDGKTDSPI